MPRLAWVTIADVGPTLRVEINPLGQLPDSDATNNEYLLGVTI